MALGEQAAHYPDCPTLVLVKVATGIGAGVIVDGQVYRGIDGGAGDIGHVRLHDYPDARCQCGLYGCLAAVASGLALAQRLTAAGTPTSSGPELIERIRSGHGEAVHLARSAGKLVGEVLATVVCLLNPGVLVIAGDLADTHFVTGVREVLYQLALPRSTRHLEVATSRLGPQAAVAGGHAMVIEQVYSPARSTPNSPPCPRPTSPGAADQPARRRCWRRIDERTGEHLGQGEVLAQDEVAGQRGDGRAEAHQDRERGGGQPAQRQQLERVGHDRRQHRHRRAQRQDRRVSRAVAGADDAQRQRQQRGGRHRERQPVDLRERPPTWALSRMYAAHMHAGPSAKPTPAGSSRSKPVRPSSATPASARPAHSQLAARRAATTDKTSGPSTSRVTATPSGMRSIAW